MNDYPTMTRAHFKFIANLIKTFEPPFNDCNQTTAEDAEQTRLTRIALANHFGRELYGTNPNFKRDRFYRAATE